MEFSQNLKSIKVFLNHKEYKKGSAVNEVRVLFFVHPSPFFCPCIHCVHFGCSLGAFNAIALIYKKKEYKNRAWEIL